MIDYKIIIPSRFKEFYIPGQQDSCWPWLGFTHPEKKYGFYSQDGDYIQAHRAAYYLQYGEFDYNLCVLHTCDNPPCVNPHHLFLGTQLQNIADRDSKKRQRWGTAMWWCCKLTEEQVRDIYLQAHLGVPQADIAKQYKITQSTVSQIKNGHKWRNLNA